MNHIRPVFLKLAFTASMLLWAGVAVTTASATSVTFAFTGVVSDVDPGLFTSGGGNNFNSGQKLSGFYTFQSTTPDNSVTSGIDTDPTIGRYNGAITAVTVNLGPFGGPTSYTATLGSPSPGNPNRIEILNSSSDGYLVQAPLDFGTPPAPNTFTPLSFRIALSNGNPLTFGDDSLPTTPPAISSFATNSWHIIFQDTFSGQARILGSISSPLTAVPLPAAVILFGVGLIALVGLGAGSWRHRKSSLA